MKDYLAKHPKLYMFYRKRALSLKRNYYTLPFIFICICSFFYLCVLFILSKSVVRCEFKLTAVFLFISVLTSILSIVAIISYTRKEYGQKRPLKMLIIYFVIITICLTFTILIFIFNEKQIASEIIKRDATDKSIDRSWYTYQTYINYGVCSRVLLIIFFVLELIANGLLIAGPIIDKKLQTIHFDSLKKDEH